MPRFVWRRASAVGRKEIFHILRDPFTLAMALVMPVFLVIMFGVAIEFNIKHVKMAVSDSDRTQDSRELIQTFGSSQYFIPVQSGSPVDALRDVVAEKARAALVIPPHFEKDLMNGRSAQVQVLLDGADNSTVGPISSYLSSIQSIANHRIADWTPHEPYEIRTRFLFNPELNSRWFIIPGLTVVIMTILSILLTSLTVAREWENGSMELLLSTPVEPLEIIVGKLAPYGILGIIGVIFVYIIARTVFGVPFVGSLWVFSLGCLIFLATYLTQGLFISIVSRNQQIAMQFAMMMGLLPTNMLSGYIFPIESMPIAFRYFTMLFPARWFVSVARSTFLKGSSIEDLGIPFIALSLSCLFMVVVSVRRFRRDLEP